MSAEIDVASLERAVLADDSDAVRMMFVGQTESARAAMAPVVAGWVADQRPRRRVVAELDAQGRTVESVSTVPLWQERGGSHWPHAVYLACAATYSAAGLTRALARRRFWAPIPEVARVLLDRDPPWLATELAAWSRRPALTDGVSGVEPEARFWWLLDILRTALGLPRPTTDFYLSGTLAYTAAADALRDPWILEHLPRMLTLPWSAHWLSHWSGTLTQLAAEQRIDRNAVLDKLLESLLAARQPAQVSSCMEAFGTIAVTPVEAAGRAAEFVALLGLPQTAAVRELIVLLRRSDELGLLSSSTVATAVTTLLERTDKGPPKLGLDWAADHVRRQPGSRPEFAPAISRGFANPDRDVQKRCVRAVLALQPDAEWPASVLQELRLRMDDLDPTVRAESATLLGLIGGPAPVATSGPTGNCAAGVLPIDPGEGPVPIRGVAEFVEVLLSDYQDLTDVDPDRLIEAAARLSVSELDEVRARLLAIAPHAQADLRQCVPLLASHIVVYAILGALDGAAALRPTPGPLGFMGTRAAQSLSTARVSGPILAFPDTAAGHVDPHRILAELSLRAGRGGRCRPSDLLQAYLRLPRARLDEAWIAGLDAIGSPDADWLAAALRRGPVEPRVVAACAPRSSYPERNRSTSRMTVSVDWDPTEPPELTPEMTHAWRHAFALPDLRPETEPGPYFYEPPVRGPYGRLDDAWLLGCPFIFPDHCEISAAHLLRRVAAAESIPPTGHIALLGVLGGATGVATHLCLAYAASSEHLAVRTETTDALIGLAHAGADPSALGRDWATLARHDRIPMLHRWSEVLGSVTVSGATGTEFVAATISGFLGVILAEEAVADEFIRRNGAHQFLAVAVEASAGAGQRHRSHQIRGLDRVAARPGRSRVLQEARRLRSLTVG